MGFLRNRRSPRAGRAKPPPPAPGSRASAYPPELRTVFSPKRWLHGWSGELPCPASLGALGAHTLSPSPPSHMLIHSFFSKCVPSACSALGAVAGTGVQPWGSHQVLPCSSRSRRPPRMRSYSESSQMPQAASKDEQTPQCGLPHSGRPHSGEEEGSTGPCRKDDELGRNDAP